MSGMGAEGLATPQPARKEWGPRCPMKAHSPSPTMYPQPPQQEDTTYPPNWFTAPASALPEPQGRIPNGIFTASSQSGRSRSPFSTWRGGDQLPGTWPLQLQSPGSGLGAGYSRATS
jgi:hypothetical protein